MIDIHFLIGFIVGAFVALELGARVVLRKLRSLEGTPPVEPPTVDERWPL